MPAVTITGEKFFENLDQFLEKIFQLAIFSSFLTDPLKIFLNFFRGGRGTVAPFSPLGPSFPRSYGFLQKEKLKFPPFSVPNGISDSATKSASSSEFGTDDEEKEDEKGSSGGSGSSLSDEEEEMKDEGGKSGYESDNDDEMVGGTNCSPIGRKKIQKN